jgi:hypothetical protein
MAKSGTYAGYEGLEPFFDVIQEGLKGSFKASTFSTRSPRTPSLSSSTTSGVGPGSFGAERAWWTSSRATETTSGFTPPAGSSFTARRIRAS